MNRPSVYAHVASDSVGERNRFFLIRALMDLVLAFALHNSSGGNLNNFIHKELNGRIPYCTILTSNIQLSKIIHFPTLLSCGLTFASPADCVNSHVWVILRSMQAVLFVGWMDRMTASNIPPGSVLDPLCCHARTQRTLLLPPPPRLRLRRRLRPILS